MAKPTKITLAIADQGRSNRSAAGHVHHFQGHRERMTQEIVSRRPPAGAPARLCLLGAGNANDVDLAALAEVFDEIHLVDIDPDALAAARRRVPPTVAARLTL